MDQTAICNLALFRLGITQGIADISDNKTYGRACFAVYEQSVRAMLKERPWPFAVRQVDLALVGENLRADWFYTYRYPTDYLTVNRVVPVVTSSSGTPVIYQTSDRRLEPQTYPFAIGSDASGRLIHTDVDDALAIGTVYISDTSLYDAMFASALAWRMAKEMAIPLTKNPQMYANAVQMYDQEVSEAFATGMNEEKPREPRDADMIRARD